MTFVRGGNLTKLNPGKSKVLKNSTTHNTIMLQDLRMKIRNYDFDDGVPTLNHLHCVLHRDQMTCKYNCQNCHCSLQQKIDSANFNQSTKVWGQLPLKKKYSVANDDALKTKHYLTAKRNSFVATGKNTARRYNDENVNYANRAQTNGMNANRYGLEGQLGCSMMEIDRKRKLAEMEAAKASAKQSKPKPRLYLQPEEEEEDYQLTVMHF